MQNDLIKRTSSFSKTLIDVLQLLPYSQINQTIVDQLSRSGFSLGANYREANETETKKDFLYRLRICRKESKETLYWLELLLHSNPEYIDNIVPLIDEVSQLIRIFVAIIEKSR